MENSVLYSQRGLKFVPVLPIPGLHSLWKGTLRWKSIREALGKGCGEAMWELLSSLLFLNWGATSSQWELLTRTPLRNEVPGSEACPCSSVLPGGEACPFYLWPGLCQCPSAQLICGQHCIFVSLFSYTFCFMRLKAFWGDCQREIHGTKREDVRVIWEPSIKQTFW